MKTVKFIIAASAALAAASCTSRLEEGYVDGNNVITEVTASINDETKTALQADGKIFWEAGDAINLFYGQDGSKFTSTVTAPAAVSKFTGSLTVLYGSEAEEGTKGGLTGADDYLWGVYPYNEANTSDGKSVTAVLPTTQIAREGSFAKDAFLTVGRSETPVMGFYAVCGAIKFQVGRSDIKSVTFKGNKNEAIAGKVKVVFTDGLPESSISSSNAQTAITLEAPEGETLKADSSYFIAMAPANFTEGFQMIFVTSDNKVGIRTSTKANELKRHVVANIGKADDGVEFVQKFWSTATVIPYAAGTLAFEVNPVTKAPELAIVQNVSGSKGPVLYFTDFKAAPAVVTPEANTNNQYISLGISAAGKSYVYTQNATSGKGEIYTSEDKTNWTAGITTIQKTNNFYGNSIGCLKNEAFMITGNNAAGEGMAKRDLNITKYDGAAWSTNTKFKNYSTAAYCIYPVLRSKEDTLYAFVTNYGKGFSISKYDGSVWSEIKTIDATSEPYKQYGYGVSEHQDVAVASDGQFWFAISTTSPKSHVILKYNPEEGTLTQIATAIPTTNSISARSCRIGLNPVTEDVYLVYRDDNQCLNVVKLDDQTFDKWGAAEQLTYNAASDVEVRFTADGKGYIVCTTAGHVEVFSLL